MVIPMKIYEGLRSKDLCDLVLPIVSIDEYKSRISDEAIVIGFIVHDKDAALDLNSFIQKSSIQILDVDTSPSPDQHGFYYVFVEIMNNELLAKTVSNLLNDVSPLVAIKKWKMKIRKTNSLIPFSEEALVSGIKKAERVNENAIYEFFKESDVLRLNIDDCNLTINEHNFEICDFLPLSKMILESKDEFKFNITFNDVSKSAKINSILGEGWNVDVDNDKLFLQSSKSDMVLVLKKIN